MPSPRNRLLGLALLPLSLALVLGVYFDRRHERRDLERKAEALTGGSVERGLAAFQHYGCGGCHAVKGVPQASGTVGPPLDGVAGRGMIGGRMENRPDNLMRWIADPQGVSPGTAMPKLGVAPAEARDIAAFLYTRT
jgi:cytochrome c2